MNFIGSAEGVWLYSHRIITIKNTTFTICSHSKTVNNQVVKFQLKLSFYALFYKSSPKFPKLDGRTGKQFWVMLFRSTLPLLKPWNILSLIIHAHGFVEIIRLRNNFFDKNFDKNNLKFGLVFDTYIFIYNKFWT